MCTGIKGIKDLLEHISGLPSKIFIVGHDEPDFDSLASAIGLQTLCTALGKEAYIIVNDSDITLEPGVKKIKERSWIEHNIINMTAYENIKDEDSALIVTDTNRASMTCMRENLNDFKDIIIVDHHQMSPDTISPSLAYIKENASSASEIVTQLLVESKVKCPQDVCTYLLAGIILDTNYYMQKADADTFYISYYLTKCGHNLATYFVDDLIYNKIRKNNKR